MFVYGCEDKLKLKPRVIMNQQSEEVQAYDKLKEIIISEIICEVLSMKRLIVEAKVSCYVIHQSWRKNEDEVITTYIHPF